MTQVLSSSMSNVTASPAARGDFRGLRGREDVTDSAGRFSKVLEQSWVAREQSQQTDANKTQKTEKNDDQSNDQLAVDEDVATLDEEISVDDSLEHDDLTPDQIDGALAAVVVEETMQSTQQSQAVSSVKTATQQSATFTGEAINPLLQAVAQVQTTGQNAGDVSTPKQSKDIADAMLRMLGITNGQQSGSHHATFTLTEVAPTLLASNTTDQSNSQQLQLPDTNASDTSDSANMGRVSRALSNAINQKGGTITIRMMPPELGQVRVDIQMHAGKVSASFQTEHQSVQSLMNRELSQLRQALERQGLTVEKLEVTQRPANSSNANASNQDNSQQSPSDGRSRGQYARENPQQANASDQQSSLNDSQNFASQLDSQL